MDIKSNFGDNLSELIFDRNITVEEFSKTVGIAFSEVYRYLRKECLPKLSNVIKIADCYDCSIDYMLGFTPYNDGATYRKTPPFCESFKKLLQDKAVTRYKLNKQTGISINCIDSWYHGNFTPSLDNAIILAKYFDCTLDYLLGREI